MDIRYFFVTDRVESNEVDIQYCPTGDMVADFFTKPLQGIAFRKFRDFIMNVDPALSTGLEDQRSVLNKIEKDEDMNNGQNMNTGQTPEEEQTWTVVENHKKTKKTKKGKES
jgi:hypothetical protein